MILEFIDWLLAKALLSPLSPLTFGSTDRSIAPAQFFLLRIKQLLTQIIESIFCHLLLELVDTWGLMELRLQ